MDNNTFNGRFIRGMEEAAKAVLQVTKEGLKSLPTLMEQISNNLGERKDNNVR